MPQAKWFGEDNNRMGICKTTKDENGDPKVEFLVKSNWVAVPVKEVSLLPFFDDQLLHLWRAICFKIIFFLLITLSILFCHNQYTIFSFHLLIPLASLNIFVNTDLR